MRFSSEHIEGTVSRAEKLLPNSVNMVMDSQPNPQTIVSEILSRLRYYQDRIINKCPLKLELGKVITQGNNILKNKGDTEEFAYNVINISVPLSKQK